MNYLTGKPTDDFVDISHVKQRRFNGWKTTTDSV